MRVHSIRQASVIILPVLIVLALTVSLSACSKTGAVQGPATSAVKDSGSDSIVYVDVRRPDEWAAGHVIGAVHIQNEQFDQRWQELEKYKANRIVVYCRTGHRATSADSILKSHGFNSVNGKGLDTLRQKGVPVFYPTTREKLDTGVTPAK